jgi:hypothetical protein
MLAYHLEDCRIEAQPLSRVLDLSRNAKRRLFGSFHHPGPRAVNRWAKNFVSVLFR